MDQRHNYKGNLQKSIIFLYINKEKKLKRIKSNKQYKKNKKQEYIKQGVFILYIMKTTKNVDTP